MPNKKQKEAAELLVEKNRDLDRLTLKVAELEAELEKYRAREADIASALTMAAQAKTNIIADAEKEADAIIRNAAKKAEGMVSEATAHAEAIESDAREKAASVLNKAKETAAELIAKTQKDTEVLLRAAQERANASDERLHSVHSAIMGVAVELEHYIKEYRQVYEQALEKRPASSPKKVPETPDAYETPEELFHAVMEIEGREAPSEAREFLEKNTLPDSVPFSDELFDGDNPTQNIEGVLSLDFAGQQAESTHTAVQVESKPDVQADLAEHVAEAIQAEVVNCAEEGTGATAAEAEILSAILDDFMGSFAADSEEAAQAEQSGVEESTSKTETVAAEAAEESTCDINSVLDGILGSEPETGFIPASDDLDSILNDIFGKLDSSDESEGESV